MGLDQYLNKRIYIGANYEHRNISGEINLKADNKPIEINLKNVSEIVEQVGYWRKANQIHAWMVANIQKGVDNCGNYYFDSKKRKELYDLCKRVLADRLLASELLPPQDGFFFGGTELDEYYFNDLEDTIQILEPTLGDVQSDYFYISSW
jgi:hypothetical protein